MDEIIRVISFSLGGGAIGGAMSISHIDSAIAVVIRAVLMIAGILTLIYMQRR